MFSALRVYLGSNFKQKSSEDKTFYKLIYKILSILIFAARIRYLDSFWFLRFSIVSLQIQSENWTYILKLYLLNLIFILFFKTEFEKTTLCWILIKYTVHHKNKTVFDTIQTNVWDIYFSFSGDSDVRWKRCSRFNVRQIRVLLRALAKIHACSFAIKCKTPR